MSLYSTSILLAERILPKEAYTYLDQKCIPISIVYTLIYQNRWINQFFYEIAKIGPHDPFVRLSWNGQYGDSQNGITTISLFFNHMFI